MRAIKRVGLNSNWEVLQNRSGLRQWPNIDRAWPVLDSLDRDRTIR